MIDDSESRAFIYTLVEVLIVIVARETRLVVREQT